MKTPLSLLLCSALPALHAGPFFFGQQGKVAASSAAPYSYPASVVAAFVSTGSGSFSDADGGSGFPDAKLAKLGLAVHSLSEAP